MELAQLSTSVRTDTGKGAARKTRATGQIPGVVYGNKHEPLMVSFSPVDLEGLFRRDDRNKNAVFELVLEEGVTRAVILQDLQVHPVSREFLHADFFNVDFEKTLIRQVPVKVVGRAEGVKMGGKLTQLVRRLKVECLPSNIPSVIEVDVTKLERKDALRVEELTLPEGVTAVYKDNFGVAVVS